MIPLGVLGAATPRVTGGGGGGSDPLFANVASLLHCDGSNGSTTFTDVKGKSWSKSGTVNISTAQSLFGGASCYFGADGYLETPDHNDFELGSGDFCLENAVRFNTLPGFNNLQCFFSKWQANQRSFYSGLYNESGTQKLFFNYSLDGSGQVANIITCTPFVINTWYRVAISRQGSNLRFFINGVKQGSDVNIGSASFFSGTSKMFFGAAELSAGSYSYYLNGYADELRVTKGAARRTANYTPDGGPYPDS